VAVQLSPQLHIQQHCGGSLNLAMVGALTPGKLENATHQGFCFVFASQTASY
jgi:hypothetical protein